jgi:hypothetical protein
VSDFSIISKVRFFSKNTRYVASVFVWWYNLSMSELLAICPYVKCRKIIFRRGNVKFEADSPNIFDFETKCPHCGNDVKIKIGLKIITEPIYI